MHRDHEGEIPDPIPRNFDGNKRCAYHSGVQGHDTEDCYGLKNQIESFIRRGVIKCTPAPPNMNNNPLPNHENRKVNMVTLDDEYGTPNYPNIDEADAMTSSAQSVITVQLREPLTVQTYLPRVVVTTLIAKKPDMDISLRIGLRPKSNGIVEPIQLKHQRGTNILGYEPTSRRDCHGSSDTIFVPEQALISDQAGIDDIVEGLGNLFVAMAGEEEGINLNKLTIRDAKPGEILQNWTTSPSLFQPESCTLINKNPRSTVMTCNDSTEKGENDEQDHEEYDESMMPENLPHEIEQVESQKKPNMDETETTKNVKILPYLHYIKELSRRFTRTEFKHVPRAQNEFADALATFSSMIQHPDKNYINPIDIEIHDQHACCFHVDEELDGKPWYYDIRRLIEAQ
uniref:Polyprotein n=1 Tax=Solanum tuberosum TaxID=4113 RepID=M1DDA9_SOLTU